MKQFASIALIANFLLLANALCPQDSANWCSSIEIAKECGTLRQCYEFVWRPINPHFDESLLNFDLSHEVSAAPLVNFTLYYETLCPDCRGFMTDQVWSAFQKIPSIMNLTLIPYGNAKATWRNETKLWQFTCQHGPEECRGNLIHTCFLYYNPLTANHLPFINCMEATTGASEDDVANNCAQKLGISLDKVFDCTNSRLGNTLQHNMAVMTDVLNPPHKYVPWVTLNGVHTEEIQDKAQRDLVGLICDTYTGPKPAGCN